MVLSPLAPSPVLRPNLPGVAWDVALALSISFFQLALPFMPEFHTETTPNPNSLKITTDAGRFIDGGLISASSVDDVDKDSLAHALLSVEGVEDVLLLPAFLTISRTDGMAWSTLMPKVEAVLREHFNGR